MLTKLLKYEFKSMARILLPIFAAALVLGLANGLFMKTIREGTDIFIIKVSIVLFIILFFIIVFASVIMTYIMSIQRFSKNLFGREGYLMNTLPVSVNQHIAAKVIVAVVFQLLATIVAFAAWLLFAVPEFITYDLSIQELILNIGNAWDKADITLKGYSAIYVIEMIFIVIISMALFNLEIYTAISIGRSGNNHKVLASFAVYIVIYIIKNYINSLALPVLNNFIAPTGMGFDVSNSYIYILIYCVLNIFYCVVCWLLTRYFIKNKLNLQ